MTPPGDLVMCGCGLAMYALAPAVLNMAYACPVCDVVPFGGPPNLRTAMRLAAHAAARDRARRPAADDRGDQRDGKRSRPPAID